METTFALVRNLSYGKTSLDIVTGPKLGARLLWPNDGEGGHRGHMDGKVLPAARSCPADD